MVGKKDSSAYRDFRIKWPFNWSDENISHTVAFRRRKSNIEIIRSVAKEPVSALTAQRAVPATSS